MQIRLMPKNTFPRNNFPANKTNIQTTHKNKLATPKACMLRMTLTRIRKLQICSIKDELGFALYSALIARMRTEIALNRLV